MKKTIPIIAASVILVLIVGYFIFNYAVKKITEREIKRITQEEISKITSQETDKITQSEIDRITDEIIKQRTEEITKKILGESAETETEQLEVACDNIPTQRQFSNTPYYTGPLVDAHLHMPSAFKIPSAFAQQADWNPPVLGKDITKDGIVCLFDKENIDYAFGFYLVTNLLTAQSVQAAKQMEQQHPKRVIPFMMSPHLTNIDLKPDEIEAILNSNKGLFKGLGEIAFYRASYKGMSPDDSYFLKIYEVADKHNLIVMMHPDYGQKQAVENILKMYPNVVFLFHGPQFEPWAVDILGKYFNVYYSLDGQFVEPTGSPESSLFSAQSTEEFIGEFKREYNNLLNSLISRFKEPIEQYPDKFLWGTDRGGRTFELDQEIGAAFEEISRSFIGQLNPDVQEKFAYKNAERLLQER